MLKIYIGYLKLLKNIFENTQFTIDTKFDKNLDYPNIPPTIRHPLHYQLLCSLLLWQLPVEEILPVQVRAVRASYIPSYAMNYIRK